MTDEDRIDHFATTLCRRLELDPFEDVTCRLSETMTPKEWAERGLYEDYPVGVSLWKSYRRQAAVFLAMHDVLSGW